ncbi:MAG: putative motility protein [Lachnospiraceae bacterium]|jgi:hypothetical protein|nr:putative motility protein [Lachnospiraceae bacterium]
MDIAGLSMNLSAIKTNSDVGIAMLSKSLDVSRASGEKMVEMINAADMERSVHPNLGGSIDLRI